MNNTDTDLLRKYIKEKLKLSITEFCKLNGISRPHFENVLNGKAVFTGNLKMRIMEAYPKTRSFILPRNNTIVVKE